MDDWLLTALPESVNRTGSRARSPPALPTPPHTPVQQTAPKNRQQSNTHCTELTGPAVYLRPKEAGFLADFQNGYREVRRA